MSFIKKLYLSALAAATIIFSVHSHAKAPTQQPTEEKKFRAPFLPKK